MVQLHAYEILRVGALPNVLSGHSSSVIIQETKKSEKENHCGGIRRGDLDIKDWLIVRPSAVGSVRKRE